MKSLSKTLHTGLLSAGIASAILPMSVAAQEMDHSKMPMPAPPQAPAPVKKSAAPESEMDHSAMGHDLPMPAAQGAMEGMDHLKMGGMKGLSPMGQAPTEPLTPIPALTDADRAAAVPPTHANMVHDDSIERYIPFNRLWAWNADPGTGMAWEGQAWFGTDLTACGCAVKVNVSMAALKALIWKCCMAAASRVGGMLVAGVRHDFKPSASQDFVAIGVMGLAPQKFEVEATAYLGERGQIPARFEAEYELLLTNRLVLQPLVEANFHGENDPPRGHRLGPEHGRGRPSLALRGDPRVRTLYRHCSRACFW